MEYIVYVKPNESGYITAVNSSTFLTDTTEWVEIDRGNGDKYHHAQGNYFDKPIITSSGVWQYKLEDGIARECTAEEIAEQEAAIPAPYVEPTVWDELDGAYTAGYESGYAEGVNSI